MGLLGSLLAVGLLALRLLVVTLFFKLLAVWPRGVGLLGARLGGWLLALRLPVVALFLLSSSPGALRRGAPRLAPRLLAPRPKAPRAGAVL